MIEEGVAGGLHHLACGPLSAPALLCLHGIGSRADGFRFQVDGLSGAFRVIAWNAPGYGDTPPLDDESPAAQDYVEKALTLLNALGISRCHVVGSSFGAIVAVGMAISAPERVASLVLTAPVVGAGHSSHTRDAELRHRRELMRDGVRAYYDRRAPDLLCSQDPRLHEIVRDITLALDPRAYLQAAHVLASADLLRTADAVRAPALVLCGERDPIAPAAHAGGPLAQVLGAELSVFPGCGHLLELEDPDRFNREVGTFVNTITENRP